MLFLTYTKRTSVFFSKTNFPSRGQLDMFLTAFKILLLERSAEIILISPVFSKFSQIAPFAMKAFLVKTLKNIQSCDYVLSYIATYSHIY